MNNAVFPGTCSSYHLHHVAGKAVALAEFLAHGSSYAQDIVTNAQALAQYLDKSGFEVMAKERGFTQSHQVLTKHGEPDDGSGKIAAKLLEDAGIITNMNMLPGDTKAMHPSGLRLGVQELTRVGMKPNDMKTVAECFQRVLLDDEDPSSVKQDVYDLKSRHQSVQYCFSHSDMRAYS